MKKRLYILALFCFPIFLFGQGRVVINNNGYIVIDNSAYVVLDNGNANALTTLGTGGNIVSENETDVIKWEIGTTTGTYVIPWTTASGTKIPLTINKTSAGTGATAEFILSTWETSTDMNVPYPSAVTNMNYHVATDGSLGVIDRFWHIDALSYAAKPNVTLTIGYDDAANEMGGANAITEANLQAQRFNTGLSHWQEYMLFGTANTGANTVSGIVVPSAEFYEDWILVDNNQPLPVSLLNFEAICGVDGTIIKWVTQSEINNDYFVVEKSYDAVNFFDLEVIPGAGNSNVPQYYSIIDQNIENTVIYYRLKQVDFDGTINYHNIVTTNCNTGGFTITDLSLNNGKLKFNVENSINEDLNIYVYDARGRMIANENLQSEKGITQVNINNLKLSTGIYMLSVIGEKNSFSTKLMSRGN